MRYKFMVVMLLLVLVAQGTKARSSNPQNADFTYVSLPNTGACDFEWTTDGDYLVTFGCGAPLAQSHRNGLSGVTTLASPTYSRHVITPIADKIYFYMQNDSIYRVPITGGDIETVAVPYTSSLTFNTHEIINPDCRDTDVAVPNTTPTASRFILSPDMSKLLYMTVTRIISDVCIYEPVYDLHSVDTTTLDDQIISDPLDVSLFFSIPYLVSAKGSAIIEAFSGDNYLVAHNHEPIDLDFIFYDIYPLHTSDMMLVEERSYSRIERFDPQTQQRTILFQGISAPKIAAISSDEQWVLVYDDSGWYNINIITAEQTPLALSPLPTDVVYLDTTNLIYESGTQLYLYNLVTTKTTLLFEDTNPDQDYMFQANHAKTGLLVLQYYTPQPHTRCITAFDYLDLATLSQTTLYELGADSSSFCTPEWITGWNPKIKFSPDDSVIVFHTNAQNVNRLHALVKSPLEDVVSQSYIPMLGR